MSCPLLHSSFLGSMLFFFLYYINSIKVKSNLFGCALDRSANSIKSDNKKQNILIDTHDTFLDAMLVSSGLCVVFRC